MKTSVEAKVQSSEAEFRVQSSEAEFLISLGRLFQYLDALKQKAHCAAEVRSALREVKLIVLSSTIRVCF